MPPAVSAARVSAPERKRSFWQTMTFTPTASAASMIWTASASDFVNGFSTSRCFLARTASMQRAVWLPGEVTIITASDSSGWPLCPGR